MRTDLLLSSLIDAANAHGHYLDLIADDEDGFVLRVVPILPEPSAGEDEA